MKQAAESGEGWAEQARGMFTMHDSEDVLKRSGDGAFEVRAREAQGRQNRQTETARARGERV